MRIIFYLLSGVCATLVGWNLSQLFILDLPLLFGAKSLPFYPDFILFPFVAICLNTAMVTTEIYLSHPTKLQVNWRNLKPYLKNTILLGLGIGFGTAILTALLYQTGMNAGFVRVIAWSLIGCLIGLSEGLSWRSRSIEGSTDKGKSRLWKSPLFGFIAGLIAAIIIEIIRQPMRLLGFEDPVGFLILGLSLGLLLSFAAAPTYQVALRAGAGFEATKSGNNNPPKIRYWDGQTFERLRFVTEDQTWEKIEEGLSIQLPAKINNQQPLIIGSGNDAHLYLPHTPKKVAELITEDGKLKLRCLVDESVKIQNETLSARGKAMELLHNQILTFIYQDNPKKYYRFIFYDRFLDPEA